MASVAWAMRWNSASVMGGLPTIAAMKKALSLVALLLTLSACGQKGPLTLPPPAGAASGAAR
ncbi:MAG: hypothetical protein Fur0014_02140 [Rubrivivax sp.]